MGLALMVGAATLFPDSPRRLRQRQLLIGTALTLFTAQRVLQSTDRVLHFAGSLVGLAIGFQLLIAKNLPGGLFHRSLGLLRRAVDSIFIHCRILVVYLFGV